MFIYSETWRITLLINQIVS